MFDVQDHFLKDSVASVLLSFGPLVLGEASCHLMRTLAVLWRAPQGKGRRCLLPMTSHVREPRWKWTLLPQSSLQFNGVLADTLTATSWETPSQTPAKLLMNP